MTRFATIGLVFGMAALAGWYFLTGGEVGKIKRVVETARASVSWDGRESELEQLAAIGRLTGCVTHNVEVQIDILGGPSGSLSGVDDLKPAILAARRQMPLVNVSILDMDVILRDDTHARVELTANFTTDKPKEINPQEFALSLRKINGSWLIEKIESIRTLRPQ
jgi:hypothetical protein